MPCSNWLFIGFISLFAGILPAQDSLLVLASTSVFADMADNIAGGRLRVESLVPAGALPQRYVLTAADHRMLERADLILYNGWGLEPWLDTLLQRQYPGLPVYRLSKGIEPLPGPDEKPDPHAWLSAENGLIYLENVREALSGLAPYDADIFAFNHGLFRQQLLDLELSIQSVLLDIPDDRRLLPTANNPFRYFGERYDFRTAALRRDQDALPAAPVLFYESTADFDFMQQQAEVRGLYLKGPLYIYTLSDSAGRAPTYLDMLTHNAELITQSLSGISSPQGRGSGNLPYLLPALLLLGALLLWWFYGEGRG